MKILFSGKIDTTHSSAGGYDKICNINLPKRILLRDNYLWPFNKTNRGHRYKLKLLNLHTNFLKKKFDITHYFYGELTLNLHKKLTKKGNNKNVITLHLDIEQKENIQEYINLLTQFDAIIVLSNEQKNLLKHKYGLESYFIPHGFQQPKFKYRPALDKKHKVINKEKINIIVVGKQYRDFETLEKIINNMEGKNSIHFHLVGVPSLIKEKYTTYSNISLYDYLNDDEYYSLISDCDYGFLPLTFATANNTILEFQYLNLPAILPNIGGIIDYAHPIYNYFYSNFTDLSNIFSNLKKIQKNNLLNEYVNGNFNWDIIYEKFKNLYIKLINN